MKNNIKELIALANKLDTMGYSKEADMCDSIVSKASKSKSAESYFEKKAQGSLHDIVDALNKLKTIRFIFDLEVQTAHLIGDWQDKKQDDNSFAVVVQLEGPKDFYVKKDSGAYLVRSSDGKGYFLPGSIKILEDPCRPIEKYFRMKVVDATDRVKKEKNLLASLRDSGAIGVMKDNRFEIVTAMYVESTAQGFGKLKSKLRRRSNFKSITANLQSIFDLEVRDDDPCATSASSSGGGVVGAGTNDGGGDGGGNDVQTQEENTTTETSSASAGRDLVSSGNKKYQVFYSKSGEIYQSDFFADKNPKKVTNSKDKKILKEFFADDKNQADLVRWTELNNVMIKLGKGNDKGSEALDGYLDSESKIAGDFLRRLNEIKKLADGSGGSGGSGVQSFKMTGFSSKEFGSWDSKKAAQLAALQDGETFSNAAVKGIVTNVVPNNIQDVMKEKDLTSLNEALE